MKYLIILLTCGLLLGCNTAAKKEATITKEKQEATDNKEAKKVSKVGDYSNLFLNYSCDMTIEEVAQVLELPIADLKMEPALNSSPSCSVRYSPNGTYQTNLSWSMIPSATKAGNKKAIDKELKDKEKGSNPFTDITLSETGDCYFKCIPMRGRIQIYNEYQDGSFGLIYGNRGNRTEEEHQQMREKMTRLANYLLKKHRK